MTLDFEIKKVQYLYTHGLSGILVFKDVLEVFGNGNLS